MELTNFALTLRHLMIFLPIGGAFSGLRTRESIRGLVGGKITLECHISGHEQWFAIMWRKVTESNDLDTIATLTPYDDPIYSPEFDTNVKRRLLSDYHFGSNTVDFNLDMYHLQCTDGATYRCDAVTSTGIHTSSTNLRVTDHPTKPNINYGILVVDINQTASLDCTGRTDVNSGTLQWYFKLHNTDAFRLVENSGHPIVIERDGCSKTLRRSMNITMLPELNNAIYRCALTDYYRSIESIHSFYDDVIIKRPEYPSISPRVTTRETMVIFPVSYIASDDSKPSSSPAARSQSSGWATLLLAIVISRAYRPT